MYSPPLNVDNIYEVIKMPLIILGYSMIGVSTAVIITKVLIEVGVIIPK